MPLTNAIKSDPKLDRKIITHNGPLLQANHKLAKRQMSTPQFKTDFFWYNAVIITSKMQSNTYNEPRIEDSILFEINAETLVEMNLTEHITRLEVIDELT